MIIFVPKGAEEDPTRPPAYYDQTYEFLKKCGLLEVGTESDNQRNLNDTNLIINTGQLRRVRTVGWRSL